VDGGHSVAVNALLKVFPGSRILSDSESYSNQVGNAGGQSLAGLVAGRSDAGGGADRADLRPSLSRRGQLNSRVVLTENIRGFVRWAGGDSRILCGELTHKQKVYDKADHERAWNSIRAALVKEFGPLISVDETHQSGGWHTHVILAVEGDVKTEFDHDVLRRFRKYGRRGRLPTGNVLYHAKLKAWRDIIRSHEGWGINGLAPVRKDTKAFALYMGKYLTKRIERGRRVSYCGHYALLVGRSASYKFSLVCGHVRHWGAGVRAFWNDYFHRTLGHADAAQLCRKAAEALKRGASACDFLSFGFKEALAVELMLFERGGALKREYDVRDLAFILDYSAQNRVYNYDHVKTGYITTEIRYGWPEAPPDSVQMALAL